MMDERLKKLEDKAEVKTKKQYYSITAEDAETLDNINEIIEKYVEKFEELGINCRIKDRR